MKCKVCGREFSKWRFCLECGSINHAYTNKNYIGEDEPKEESMSKSLNNKSRYDFVSALGVFEKE